MVCLSDFTFEGPISRQGKVLTFTYGCAFWGGGTIGSLCLMYPGVWVQFLGRLKSSEGHNYMGRQAPHFSVLPLTLLFRSTLRV